MLNLCKDELLDRFPEHMDLETYFNYVRPLYNLWEAYQPAGPVYFGVPLHQWPFDPWLYQEVLFANPPRTLIELGTGGGRTTEWFAEMLHRARGSDYEIYTVEIQDQVRERVLKGNITPLLANSLDQSTFDRIAALAEPPIALTLDSDHSRHQVYHELKLWSSLVTPGHYCIVQDTWLHVWQSTWQDAALGGIKQFMEENSDFQIDTRPQRWMLTQCPFGWLRRRS
jgi:cephalosporin hydroxylase